MIKLLQSTWMTAVIGSILFLATLFLGWREMPAPTTHRPVPAKTTKGAGFVLSDNSDLPLLIADLQRRKEELDNRDKQLHELEIRLKAEATELTAVTQRVAGLQKAFDEKVLTIQHEEAGNLKKLAKTYSAMTPESAATILRELDDPGIVKILIFMKEEDTARILEALSHQGEANAKRVALLSEKLRMALPRQTNEKKT